jgi:glycosyltransferase involved in cell wall biosynthesis
MIVKNEGRCIERCLRSAAPHVDRMVVLDTGSQDNTVGLARACGAEVHEVSWPSSFATARNQALTLADADWNLVLDADEWIESGGEALRTSIAQCYALGVVPIHSKFYAGGAQLVNVDWITRLLPRGVRYVGEVHEQPDTDLPRHRLPLVICHDGYLPEAMKAKKGRNRTLLLAMLRDAGGQDGYLLFQLGKDFEAYGEFAEAVQAYQRSVLISLITDTFRTSLVIRLMRCLSKLGQLEQVVSMAGDALNEMAHSPDFFFTLGDLCLDAAVAHPLQAEREWLPMATSAWLRCLDIGEQPEQSDSVLGRGSYLAAHNLAVVHDGLGRLAEAAHYRALSEAMRRVPGGSIQREGGHSRP